MTLRIVTCSYTGHCHVCNRPRQCASDTPIVKIYFFVPFVSDVEIHRKKTIGRLVKKSPNRGLILESSAANPHISNHVHALRY